MNILFENFGEIDKCPFWSGLLIFVQLQVIENSNLFFLFLLIIYFYLTAIANHKIK